MTGRINHEHVRVLTRLPHARIKADRLRDLAMQSPMITWTMSDATALTLADIIERGADAVEGIEAQLRAQDKMMDEARLRMEAAKARMLAGDAAAALRRADWDRRTAIADLWFYAAGAAVFVHYFLTQIVGAVLAVVGHG
jgi:hypothetical protein